MQGKQNEAQKGHLDNVDAPPCHHFPHDKCFGVVLERSTDAFLVNYEQHAHAHVEGTEHLRLRNVASLQQPQLGNSASTEAELMSNFRAIARKSSCKWGGYYGIVRVMQQHFEEGLARIGQDALIAAIGTAGGSPMKPSLS